MIYIAVIVQLDNREYHSDLKKYLVILFIFNIGWNVLLEDKVNVSRYFIENILINLPSSLGTGTFSAVTSIDGVGTPKLVVEVPLVNINWCSIHHIHVHVSYTCTCRYIRKNYSKPLQIIKFVAYNICCINAFTQKMNGEREEMEYKLKCSGRTKYCSAPDEDGIFIVILQCSILILDETIKRMFTNSNKIKKSIAKVSASFFLSILFFFS